MFDVSASEVLLIGAVALIVIGPKELPGVLRMVGQTVGKLKRMAGEFRTQFDDAMREADLHEIQKSVSEAADTASSVTNFNPINTIRNEIRSTVDELKSATRSAEAEIAKPIGSASAAVAEEQGPPVVEIDPLPPPYPPMRLTPDLPTPAEPAVLSVPAEPVETPPAPVSSKPPRKAKARKSGGESE